MTLPDTYTRLRVFCRSGEGGNPLAIVDAPGGSADDVMQSLAEAIGLSETVFLAEPPASSLSPQSLRIFTPAREITFAGHPLVGVAWFCGQSGHPAERLLTTSGEVEAGWAINSAWIRTEAPTVSKGPEDVFPIVEMLGAEPIDLTPRLPTALVGRGEEWLIMPFAEPARVRSLEPDMEALALTGRGIYCFALRRREVTARFFAPALGVPEDPATGSAAIALAAYLTRYRRYAGGELVVNQGQEVGRPCQLRVAMDGGLITLGGEVVSDGEVVMPASASGVEGR